MAKQTAGVDEDVIRQMVTGDIPRLGVVRDAAIVPPKPKLPTDDDDYASTFLRKREPAQKRQTYISAAHFAKITEILAVLASDVSVPTFLDNLLADHLEQHRDQINELYADKFKKPL